MLLVIDIGNSNIVLGAYEGKTMQHHWRVSTDRQKTGDEYGMLLNNLFHYSGLTMKYITAVIISSVVPPIIVPFVRMCRRYFNVDPLVVGPGIKTGICIKYENPREVGADRIVNAVAAYEMFGGPLIIIDFGTATTFCAIADNGGWFTVHGFPAALLANPADAFRLYNLSASEATAAAAGVGGAAATVPVWQSLTSILLWPVLALALAIAAFRKVIP